MLRVLKAPENIGYQLALTTSELRSLFAHAAPIPAADAKAPSSDGNRKPIDGECPICYCEFEVAEKENIVYCKAACGNNVHKDCMASWATAKQGKATCPYCRAAWEDTTIEGKVDLKGAQRNEDGYLNVASQLGISGIRGMLLYWGMLRKISTDRLQITRPTTNLGSIRHITTAGGTEESTTLVIIMPSVPPIHFLSPVILVSPILQALYYVCKNLGSIPLVPHQFSISLSLLGTVGVPRPTIYPLKSIPGRTRSFCTIHAGVIT